MSAWFTQFWNDPVLFESVVRALIKGLGALAFSGVLDAGSVGWWFGLAAMVLGGEVPVRRRPGQVLPTVPPVVEPAA